MKIVLQVIWLLSMEHRCGPLYVSNMDDKYSSLDDVVKKSITAP